MFEGFTPGVRAVDGVEIAYVTQGAGPPLLLLHGFPQTKAMWAQVAPKLAQHFTVVCSDLRGYGSSAKPACTPDASNYSFRAMAADQAGLMRALGHERFHLVGHDRGARTSHRLALDHSDAVMSLTVMDIVPTHKVLSATDRHLAQGYWHWFFLSQPAPFPERLIGNDPDFFYETCLGGWGGTGLKEFHPEQLSEYRRAWRDPGMIQGSCGDYRAAVTVDFAHDTSDLGRKVQCPSLVLYGANGLMGKLFDLEKEWGACLARMQVKAMTGGHFFPDQYPDETAAVLREFLTSVK